MEMICMLEMFFDNEKVFSVFEQIIKSGSQEICVPKILFDLKIPVDEAADILQSFVFLDIIEETDKTVDEGIFKFNPDSPVVLSLCLFDDIVSKYTFEKLQKLLGDGDSCEDFLSFTKDENDKGELKDSDMKTIEDFLSFMKDL